MSPALTLNVPTCADGVPTFKGHVGLNEEHVLVAQQWAAAQALFWGCSDEHLCSTEAVMSPNPGSSPPSPGVQCVRAEPMSQAC